MGGFGSLKICYELPQGGAMVFEARGDKEEEA
jgi:hypothetical protein